MLIRQPMLTMMMMHCQVSLFKDFFVAKIFENRGRLILQKSSFHFAVNKEILGWRSSFTSRIWWNKSGR